MVLAASRPQSKRRVITLPKPMPHQRRVLLSEARLKVVAAGRRWGKTKTGLIAVIDGHGPARGYHPGANQGAKIWWCAPTYAIAQEIWRDLKGALRDAWISKYEGEHRIVLPGGGSITVKSTDNYDGLRGTGLDGVVLDEFAYMNEDVWPKVIRPALSDRQGWAIFISTPRMGPAKTNHFLKLFKLAQDKGIPEYQTFQGPTSENFHIPPEEIEAARYDLDPISYRQEYLAEFVANAGTIVKPEWIRRYERIQIRDVTTKDGHESVEKHDAIRLQDENGERVFKLNECTVFVSVDLAASLKETADFTVVTTFAMTPQSDLVVLDVIKGRIEGPDQADTVVDSLRYHNAQFAIIEKVGYQLTMIQELVRRGMPIQEFRPDKDKLSRFLPVSARFKNGKIFHPIAARWLNEVEDELTAFSEVEHDDVCDTYSLAVAHVMFHGAGPSIRRL